jgi:cytochrome c553
MKQEPVLSSRNSWSIASIGTITAIALAAAVVGFAWLPSLLNGAQYRNLWDAICTAAGLIRVQPIHEQVVRPDHPTTSVAFTPEMFAAANAEAIGRGATLALRCTMCHGARGLSDANSPNLAGQFRETIYKELVDFKTGARRSAVMSPIVPFLNDENMRDLAEYYAYLPRSADQAAAGEPPRIAVDGAPMRGIAPCGACHGELGVKAGAAWLEGQPATYLRTQLDDFASGMRTNDIDEQMRNIARRMTPQDVDVVSQFYAGRR